MQAMRSFEGRLAMMTGQAHWMPFLFLIVTAALVTFMWVRGRLEDRKYLVEKGKVRCRQRNNDLVRISYVRDRKSGEPIGILSCSKEPGIVRCNRACLPLLVRGLKPDLKTA
jgi:hypothetical protein